MVLIHKGDLALSSNLLRVVLRIGKMHLTFLMKIGSESESVCLFIFKTFAVISAPVLPLAAVTRAAKDHQHLDLMCEVDLQNPVG